jgi:prepilin-type N-terminal cleavage/methylation domain-containing protein
MPVKRHPSFFAQIVRGQTETVMRALHGSKNRDTGFTLIELLVVIAIIGIVGAIAIPALLRAKMTANETAVLGSMRAINSAQAAYASAASTGGYAPDFATLVQPCPGNANGFISADVAGDPALKSGYFVALAPGTLGPGPTDCNGDATSLGYYLTAVPVTIRVTGHRAFASTSPGVIYFDPNGIAPTEAQMRPNGGATPVQ